MDSRILLAVESVALHQRSVQTPYRLVDRETIFGLQFPGPGRFHTGSFKISDMVAATIHPGRGRQAYGFLVN
jgi:hypothetical protein